MEKFKVIKTAYVGNVGGYGVVISPILRIEVCVLWLIY